MRSFQKTFVWVIPFLLNGCAAHPLPEDFEQFNTVRIVEHVRCEAQKAIQDVAIGYLRGEHNDTLADYLENNRNKFVRFNTINLTSKEEIFYHRYIDSAIAMDFTFGVTEDNEADTNIDLTKALTNGAFSLNLKASNDRKRDTSRHVVISDKFRSLLDGGQLICNSGIFNSSNLVYPVTGTLGLGELIGTFVKLNQDGIVIRSSDLEKAPVFSDQLTFTTTLSGSVAPKVTLTPIGHRFQLADASLTNVATRTDANKVIVGLSLAPVKKSVVMPVAAGVLGGLAGTLSNRADDPAVRRALQAISDTRLDSFFDHFGQSPLQ